MQKLFLFFILLSNLIAKEVTFEQLVNSALNHALELQMATTDVNIAHQERLMVHADDFPVLSVNYGGEYSKNYQNSAGSIGNTLLPSTTAYKNSLSFGMQYNLFQFGASLYQKEAVKLGEQIKQLEVCEVRRSLYEQVLESYYKTLQLQTTVRFEQRILQLQQQKYEVVKRLFDAGEINKITLAEEAIALLELQKELHSVKEQHSQHRQQLAFVSYTPLEDKDKLASLSIDFVQKPLTTYENSLEAQLQRLKLKQKEASFSAFKASKKPAISLYGDYYIYGSDPDSFRHAYDDTHRSSWRSGFSISWIFFEGFKEGYETQKYRHELFKLRLEDRLTKRQFEQTLHDQVIEQRKSEQNYENQLQIDHRTRYKKEVVSRFKAVQEVDEITHIQAQLDGLRSEAAQRKATVEHAYQTYLLAHKNQSADQCQELIK
jgi:outer membrane protein TolC